MLKTEFKESKVVEGFSVLKMKQEIQDRIYHETKEMDPEEICEYFRKGSGRFRQENNSENNNS